MAAAPSVIPEALPAVTTPSLRKTGSSLVRDSRVVPSRGCSSLATVTSPFLPGTLTGAISRVEAAVGAGALAAELALQGVGVGRGAVDADLRGQLLGGLAHDELGERAVEAVLVHAVDDLGVAQAVARAGAGEQVRRVRHALRAAREHHPGLAGQDRARRREHRLQAGGARLVHGEGRADRRARRRGRRSAGAVLGPPPACRPWPKITWSTLGGIEPGPLQRGLGRRGRRGRPP